MSKVLYEVARELNMDYGLMLGYLKILKILNVDKEDPLNITYIVPNFGLLLQEEEPDWFFYDNKVEEIKQMLQELLNLVNAKRNMKEVIIQEEIKLLKCDICNKHGYVKNFEECNISYFGFCNCPFGQWKKEKYNKT